MICLGTEIDHIATIFWPSHPYLLPAPATSHSYNKPRRALGSLGLSILEKFLSATSFAVAVALPSPRSRRLSRAMTDGLCVW